MYQCLPMSVMHIQSLVSWLGGHTEIIPHNIQKHFNRNLQLQVQLYYTKNKIHLVNGAKQTDKIIIHKS